MQRDELTLEEDAPYVMLRAHEEAFALRMPEGFALEDIRAALLCTGWVEERDRCLRRTNWLPLARLGPFVEEMLAYFVRANEPRAELRSIISTVEHGDLNVPLFAFAWLDLVVRDDLADAARSAGGIWNADTLTIDLAALRQARIEELLARYTLPAAQLAPSRRTRAVAQPHFKTGG